MESLETSEPEVKQLGSVSAVFMLIAVFVLIGAVAFFGTVRYDGPIETVTIPVGFCTIANFGHGGVSWESTSALPASLAEGEIEGTFQTNGDDRAIFISSDGQITLQFQARAEDDYSMECALRN